MSAWRLAMRVIGQLGGEATTAEVDKAGGTGLFPGPSSASSALSLAHRMGLLESEVINGYRGGRSCGKGGHIMRWHVSPLGWRFLDGRVALRPSIRNKSGGRYFGATWLDSLPLDVRIGVPEGWEP
jgi:hypothetical protein